jgi:hypothetical protein
MEWQETKREDGEGRSEEIGKQKKIQRKRCATSGDFVLLTSNSFLPHTFPLLHVTE